MRNSKTINVNDKDIVVQEFTVRQLRDIAYECGENLDLNKILEIASTKLLNITPEQFLDFTPSDIEKIFCAIKEVNEAFFKIPDHLRKIGLGGAWDNLKASILSVSQSK